MKTPLPKKPLSQTTKKTPVRKESPYGFLLPLLVILPLVFAAFYPILNNGFTNWDDEDLILDNPLIRHLSWENTKHIFTTFYFGNYQPLHIFSYSVEFHLWGLNPAGYHAVSLIMFLITTSLVYIFICKISKENKITAILGTLLFAISAMRVESVAWAAERKDMLYSMFYVASLIAYVSYLLQLQKKGSGLRLKYLILAFLFFTLSVFSKVMAVSIVGAMVMLDYLLERKITLRLILEKIPFIIVSIILGLVQVAATASTGTIDKSNLFNHADRVLIVCRNFVFYIYKMLVPVNLSTFYPYPTRLPGTPWPAEFYIAPFIVVVIIGLLIWSFRKSRIPLFCAGFFFSALALVLQFIAIGPTMFSERYSLIPAIALSFGIASGVVSLVQHFPKMKMNLFGSTGVYLIVMFYLTFTRCDVWQTSLTLWDNVLRQFPEVPIALHARGQYFGKELGNNEQALSDISAAIRLDPAYDMAYSNRGILYYKAGKFDSAILDFNNAIRLKGEFYQAVSNRAIVYAQTNRPDLAVKDFTRSIELMPEQPGNYLYRGYAYVQLNKPELAIEDFNKGISLDPGNSEMFFQRANAHYLLKKFPEAYTDIQQARTLGRQIDEAMFNQMKQSAGK